MDHTTGSNVPLFVIEFSRGFIDQPKFVYNNLTGKSEFKITTTSILEKLNNATGARTVNAVHQANFPAITSSSTLTQHRTQRRKYGKCYDISEEQTHTIP